MAFTFFDEDNAAFAGQIARGDQSTSKAWAQLNSGDSTIFAGRFVAKHATKNGVTAVANADDAVAGIALRRQLGRNYEPGEMVNVGHIGVGDAVWALIDTSAAFDKNGKIYIVATGENAGAVTNTEEGNIATSFTVGRLSGNVAEITRKEV